MQIDKYSHNIFVDCRSNLYPYLGARRVKMLSFHGRPNIQALCLGNMGKYGKIKGFYILLYRYIYIGRLGFVNFCNILVDRTYIMVYQHFSSFGNIWIDIEVDQGLPTLIKYGVFYKQIKGCQQWLYLSKFIGIQDQELPTWVIYWQIYRQNLGCQLQLYIYWLPYKMVYQCCQLWLFIDRYIGRLGFAKFSN